MVAKPYVASSELVEPAKSGIGCSGVLLPEVLTVLNRALKTRVLSTCVFSVRFRNVRPPPAITAVASRSSSV